MFKQNKMTQADYRKNVEKCIFVAENGLKYDPSNLRLHKIKIMNCLNLQKMDDALQSINQCLLLGDK